MSILKQSVALDVAKDQLDACFAAIDMAQRVKVKATRKFDNTPTGFKELHSWVKKHADPAIPLVYTMEATDLRCSGWAGPVSIMNKLLGIYLLISNQFRSSYPTKLANTPDLPIKSCI